MANEELAKKKEIHSELPGFFKKTVQERIDLVSDQVSLSPKEKQALIMPSALDLQTAEHMIENVIGTFPLPVGIATNFLINKKDYFVPMSLEEPSVIAAASFGAKLARPMGGFTARCLTKPKMISQVQLVGLSDWTDAIQIIEKEKDRLLKLANCFVPSLVVRGGGITDIQCREINTKRGVQLIVHLLVNVSDSMGANIVTRMAEGLAPRLEQLTGARSILRILSNLAVERVYRAEAVWSKESLAAINPDQKVDELIEGILDAWALADADPFRAATHNKGIMNGIDAVALATGNDFRALEAGAHSYAAYNREYGSLSRYEKTTEGDLKGIIEIPLAVATAGGITQVHPIANVSKRILNVQSSDELACVIAAVGLAQNFAALRALAAEGILKGHLKLHAKNIAIMGGAKGNYIEIVASIMACEGNISTARAKELVNEMCFVM